MGTTKVEVGSRANGSFGSDVNAPAGYHPRPAQGLSSGTLGFRGNPTECDWDDPACIQISQGDFFIPGSPYEAWALQVGSGTAAFNTNGVTGIAGSFTGVSATTPSGTWEATAPYDGIQVRFDYTVPTFSWLINANVTLTNTTGAAISDVYFLRGVDPDNCKADPATGRPPPPLCTEDSGSGPGPVTSTYQTYDTVMSNGPATGLAKVTATQTDDSFLSLQLASNTANAFRKTGSFANSGNLANIYAGTDVFYVSDVGNTVLEDEAIYIVEKIASIPAGGSVTLPVKYVLKEGAPVNPPKQLTVTKDGTGSGTVSSSPAGIDCGATCAFEFNDGTSVTLTASAAEGSTFAGWGGACSGTESTCTVTMSEARSVSATFNAATPPTPPSNEFTATLTRNTGNVLVTRVKVPGAGVISQTGTRASRGKRVKACATEPRSVTRARTVSITCRATSATRAARRKAAVKVRLCTTFTPTGGIAETKCRSVTLAKIKAKRPKYTG